jgi:hypothetical protein
LHEYSSLNPARSWVLVRSTSVVPNSTSCFWLVLCKLGAFYDSFYHFIFIFSFFMRYFFMVVFYFTHDPRYWIRNLVGRSSLDKHIDIHSQGNNLQNAITCSIFRVLKLAEGGHQKLRVCHSESKRSRMAPQYRKTELKFPKPRRELASERFRRGIRGPLIGHNNSV